MLPNNFKYAVPKTEMTTTKKSQRNVGFASFADISNNDNEMVCAQLPPSYIDSNVSCQYKLVTAVDTPVVLIPMTQICHNIVIESEPGSSELDMKSQIYSRNDCAGKSAITDDKLLHPRFPVFGLNEGCKGTEKIIVKAKDHPVVSTKAPLSHKGSDKVASGKENATNVTPVPPVSQNRNFLPQIFKQLFKSTAIENAGAAGGTTTVKPSMVSKFFRRNIVTDSNCGAVNAKAPDGSDGTAQEVRSGEVDPPVTRGPVMQVSAGGPEPHVLAFSEVQPVAPSVFRYTCRVEGLCPRKSPFRAAVAPFAEYSQEKTQPTIRCIVQVCNQIWIRVPKHIATIPSSTNGSHVNLFMKNESRYGATNWVLIRNYVLSESQQVVPFPETSEGQEDMKRNLNVNISAPIVAQCSERVDALSMWPFPRPIEHKVQIEQAVAVTGGTRAMPAFPRRNSFERNAVARRQILQGGGPASGQVLPLPSISNVASSGDTTVVPGSFGIAATPRSTTTTPCATTEVTLSLALPVATVRQYTVQSGHFESRVVLDIRFVEESEVQDSIFPPCRTEILITPSSLVVASTDTGSTTIPMLSQHSVSSSSSSSSSNPNCASTSALALALAPLPANDRAPSTPPRELASHSAGGRRGGRGRGRNVVAKAAVPQASVASPLGKAKAHHPKTPTAKPVRGRPAVKVVAASVSRGPAAVLIDRNRRYTSSRHPQNTIRSPRALPDGSNCVSLLTVVNPTVSDTRTANTGAAPSTTTATNVAYNPEMLSAATAAIISSVATATGDPNTRSTVPAVVAAEAAVAGGDAGDGSGEIVTTTARAARAARATAATAASSSSSSGPPGAIPVVVCFPETPYLSPIPDEYILLCQTQSLANRQGLTQASPEVGGDLNSRSGSGDDDGEDDEVEEDAPATTSPIPRVLRYDEQELLDIEEVGALQSGSFRAATVAAANATAHAVLMNASTVASARVAAAVLPPPTPTIHYQESPREQRSASREHIDLSTADAVTLFNTSMTDLNNSLNASGIADMMPDVPEDFSSPSPLPEHRDHLVPVINSGLVIENI